MPHSELSAQELVGRDDELAHIGAFLADAAVRGGVLLVSGEPGVGKTALVEAAAWVATEAGTRALRAAGVEFEADVSYSGLNQLLFPLQDDLQRLAPDHREALRIALGFGSGPAPDRLLVSNAALLLVRLVAAERPLLLVVDDLPWLDRASTAVLGFIARRLNGSRVGFLAASRNQAGDFFERGGLPAFELQPLGQDASNALIVSRFPGLPATVRRRLLAEASGNPLALLELPAALSEQQHQAVVPLSQRLQRFFADRVSELPERCRELMLLGALDGSGELGTLLAAAGETYRIDELEPAERDRLLHIRDGRRYVFRHPLIASAVIEASTSGQRRWAHTALAGTLVSEPERRAWHLGEAAVGADESVALLLEQAAHRILRRGDAVGAVAALTRSADLSPDPTFRSRRLAEAAYIGADAGGELTNASKLLDDARRTSPSPGDSLHAAAAAVYLLLNADGDVSTAHRLLVGAIEAGEHGHDADDKALIDALHTLLLLCFFAGTPQAWGPFFAALDKLTPGVPEPLAVAALTFADPARTGQAATGRLDTLADSLREEPDPTQIVRIGTASIYLDRLSNSREANWRVVHRGRDGVGPARRHLGALLHLCFDDYHTGRWAEADELADEGLRLCEEYGYRFFTWYFRYIQAMLAAARGDGDASFALTGGILAFAAPRGVRAAEFFAYHAQALNNLGRGDYDCAYNNAVMLGPVGAVAPYVPHAMWVGMDLVEAALRTNRQAEAAAHAEAMNQANLGGLSSRLALLSAGATAMAADQGHATELFRKALAVPDAERWPFDFARVQLAYGRHLRRVRATARARLQIRTALETFERLGARPWSEQANNELRATGMSRPRNIDRDTPTLTVQEREIAELAGSGLTNKQIAERLFLSHRTVGAHLYQIFPKLGITSRAGIRDALTAMDQDEDLSA